MLPTKITPNFHRLRPGRWHVHAPTLPILVAGPSHTPLQPSEATCLACPRSTASSGCEPFHVVNHQAGRCGGGGEVWEIPSRAHKQVPFTSPPRRNLHDVEFGIVRPEYRDGRPGLPSHTTSGASTRHSAARHGQQSAVSSVHKIRLVLSYVPGGPGGGEEERRRGGGEEGRGARFGQASALAEDSSDRPETRVWPVFLVACRRRCNLFLLRTRGKGWIVLSPVPYRSGCPPQRRSAHLDTTALTSGRYGPVRNGPGSCRCMQSKGERRPHGCSTPGVPLLQAKYDGLHKDGCSQFGHPPYCHTGPHAHPT